MLYIMENNENPDRLIVRKMTLSEESDGQVLIGSSPAERLMMMWRIRKACLATNARKSQLAYLYYPCDSVAKTYKLERYRFISRERFFVFCRHSPPHKKGVTTVDQIGYPPSIYTR